MYTTTSPHSILVPTRHERFLDGDPRGSFINLGSLTFNDVRSGTKVDNFQQKIERHENAASNFDADYYNCSVFPGTNVLRYTVNGIPNQHWVESFTGCYNPLSTIDHPLAYTDEERAKALEKLYKKLRNERTVFDGMTFLGELRETIAMIRRPATALRDGFDKQFKLLESRKLKVMKMPWQRRRRVWEDIVTGTYLETVFGLMPTISDIGSICEVIKSMYERKFPASRITSRSSFSKNDIIDSANAGFVDPGSQWYLLTLGDKTTTSSTMQVQYSVGIDITQGLNQSALMRLKDLSGFRLDEFIPSLYAVTPFSWLIDYLSTIGSFIGSVTYDQSQVRWVVETVTRRTFCTQYTKSPDKSYYSAYLAAADRTVEGVSGDLGHSTLTRTTVSRRVLENIPNVPIVVTFDGINIKRALNVAAVALQLRSHSDLSWLSKKGP